MLSNYKDFSSEYVSEVKAEVLAPFDVVVAGGGTAGVTAALAAARGGAKTLLIESTGCLGGMMTRGNAGLTMYTKFSGNPDEHKKDLKTLKEDPDELQVSGGLAKELTDRLMQAKNALGTFGHSGKYVFSATEDFKNLLFSMMEESNVNLRLHSMVVDVIQHDNQLLGLVLESKSGRQVVPAQQFIDATGDGDVAVRAGVPYTVGVTTEDVCASKAKIGEMMPMGVMFKVGNVDLPQTFKWLKENPQYFRKQIFARFTLDEAIEQFEQGGMSTFCVYVKKIKRSCQVYNSPNSGEVTICCPSVKGDGTNVEDLSRAEIIMAAMIHRWMEGLRDVAGFENSYLLDFPEIGVRETCHIQGDYVLNLEDIYHTKQFDDCIGFGSHPIDTQPRPEWLEDPETAYPPRWSFQIPFRSLIAKNKENLLVAGRCISATHEAFGCIRPTVQCMIVGEAAGTAAALCIKKNTNPRILDIAELRKCLKTQGVKC